MAGIVPPHPFALIKKFTLFSNMLVGEKYRRQKDSKTPRKVGRVEQKIFLNKELLNIGRKKPSYLGLKGEIRASAPIFGKHEKYVQLFAFERLL